MAIFNISVGGELFSVTNIHTISTECSTVYKYEIIAQDNDNISIVLTGNHMNPSYTLNGITTPFTNSTNINYNTSLFVSFSLRNGGGTGVFNECSLDITNTTTTSSNNNFTFDNVREDDSPICVNENAADYDTLDDTPSSKVGSAGKFIRVSDDEQTHEYVDLDQNVELQIFDSSQLAFDTLGPGKLFRWSQVNYDGIPSINSTQVGKTKLSN